MTSPNKTHIPFFARYSLKNSIWLVFLPIFIFFLAVTFFKWPLGKPTELTAIIEEASASHGYGEGGISVVVRFPDNTKSIVHLPASIPAIKGKSVILLKQKRLFYSELYTFVKYEKK